MFMPLTGRPPPQSWQVLSLSAMLSLFHYSFLSRPLSSPTMLLHVVVVVVVVVINETKLLRILWNPPLASADRLDAGNEPASGVDESN